MAAKRKTTPRKGTSRRNVPRKAKVTRINQQNNPLSNEIFCIIILALSSLVLISLFGQDSMGPAGALIRKILTGLFGIGGYLLPISLAAFSIYMLFHKTAILKPAKSYGAVVLFFAILCLWHIKSYDPSIQYSNVAEYILGNYQAGSPGNGGFFGALFGNAFFLVIGKAGSYIMLTATVLVCATLISGHSFFNGAARLISWIQSAFTGVEDDGEEEEAYEYEEEPAPVKPRGRRAATTEALPAPGIPPAAKSKTKPKLYVLDKEKGEEEEQKEKKKILLFSEELKPKSSFRSQLAEKTVLVGADRKYGRPGETRLAGDEAPEGDFFPEPPNMAAPPFAMPEITVKGIYEEDDNMDAAETAAAAEALLPEEMEIPTEWKEEIYINTTPVLPRESKPSPAPPKPQAAPSLPPPMPRTVRIEDELAVSAGQREPLEYYFPSLDFLNPNPNQGSAGSRAQILENSRKLEDTLKSFGVEARVVEVSKGPTVTRYELSPGAGVKVSRISGLADDLALNLAAVGIRIEAPIPGKAAVGIEIPNKEVQPVYLREVLEDELFQNYPSKLAFALGKDIAGNPVVTDIAKMPHLLIAGATGSGKSVCVNTLITSIIYKARPDEVKLLMVDPKVVELSIYNGIPHLLIPVVTDPKKASGALNWAVREMVNRYNLFAETAVRDLKGYNAFKAEMGDTDFLPQIVIIIDELADLMMAAPGEVEESICRLAQMARAAGLHLIIATQRPSVDVITGLIKANIPSRLAFAVSSGTDSRTILDMVGAEKLLGKGDMLFNPVGMGKPMRVQGAFISDKEVESIVSFLKQGQDQQYDQDMIDNITSTGTMNEMNGEVDEFFEDAVAFIIGKEKASASMLQRQFRIGYNRASRLIEDLETRGIVGPEDGSKPRKVLMTRLQWQAYKEGQESRATYETGEMELTP